MLLKIYSDTKLIEPVNFKVGLNIILGKYSDSQSARGPNGIGKSTLIRLVNFCLLSDSAEKLFLQDKYSFLTQEAHSICLDFVIDEKYFTVKRYFDDPSFTHFGETGTKLTQYSKAELREVFLDLFFPIVDEKVVYKGNKYGTLMNFFVKDDLDSQERSSPLNFLGYKGASAREIALYNFFLLGLPTENIIKFIEKYDEKKITQSTIKTLNKKLEIDTGKSIEEFRSEKIKVEKTIYDLEKSLNDFSFLETYKDVEGQITKLTVQINENLHNYHSLSSKLKKIQESFALPDSFDGEKIRKIYNESLENFGDMIQHTLEEVNEFKKKVILNRKRFLLSTEKSLKDDITKILDSISKLETKRSSLYKILDEKGALDSVKNTYENLLVNRSHLEKNLATIQKIDNLKETSAELAIDLAEIKKNIIIDLNENSAVLNNLRELFQDILASAIFMGEAADEAYFDIALADNSSAIQLPFTNKVSIPRADALGQSRLKIVSYDLMLFLNQISEDRKLPKFLIHDGVFHGIIPKTKVNTLNYVYSSFLQQPHFQYIVTFNEDELLLPENKEESYGRYSFDIEDQIIAVYEDVPEKMIFKRAFD